MEGLAGLLGGIIIGFGVKTFMVAIADIDSNDGYWKRRAKVLEDRMLSIKLIVTEESDSE